MEVKVCQEVTKTASPARRRSLKTGPIAKIEPVANVLVRPMKVEAIPRIVKALMMRMLQNKTRTKRTMNNTTPVLVTYQVLQKCNRSSFPQLTTKEKNMKVSNGKMMTCNVKLC